MVLTRVVPSSLSATGKVLPKPSPPSCLLISISSIRPRSSGFSVHAPFESTTFLIGKLLLVFIKVSDFPAVSKTSVRASQLFLDIFILSSLEIPSAAFKKSSLSFKDLATSGKVFSTNFNN